MLTVRDNPFLVFAVEPAGCAAVWIRIWVTVWAGLTVCTPIGALSVGVVAGVATGSDELGVEGVVGVVAVKNRIIYY